VDEHEAEHLRRENRQLRQALTRWRALAGLLAGVVAALLVAGGVAGVLLGTAWARQQEEEAARQAASRSLKQLHITVIPADLLRWDREQHKAALALVTGGLTLAALDVAGGD
jgi:hypothetical protein